jgi:hypothetical protein
MKECGRCHAMAPETTTKCPACGALLVAAPVPIGARTTGVETASSATPPRSSLDPFGDFTANPLPPTATPLPPAPVPARTSYSAGMVFVAIIVMLALGGAVYVMRGGGGSASDDAPVVLEPQESMSGGIPGSLSDAVRVQAESNRQTAAAAVMQTTTQTGGGIDRALLHQAQPDFEWLGSGDSSTSPKEVSIGDTPEGIMIAISASNKTVCAFARLSNQGGGPAEYVTMGNMKSCAAEDAPADGWSQRSGGYGGTPPLDG